MQHFAGPGRLDLLVDATQYICFTHFIAALLPH